MNLRLSQLFILIVFCCLSMAALGQNVCPARPSPGSTIRDPEMLQSQNGTLTVNFTMYNSLSQTGAEEYCYVYSDGTEAPTLLLNPGDTLIVNLTNRLTAISGARHMSHGGSAGTPGDPCAGGETNSATTNIHFHGLNVPPTCHQDDVIKTVVQPNDPTFQYRIQIPANDPPGLYWYHPHPHGFTVNQVMGGAAGALIINGMQSLHPEVADLTQRVLVIRQQPLGGHGDPDQNAALTTNFVIQRTIENPAPTLLTKPSEKQFWRIINATSTIFLRLQVLLGAQAEKVELVAVDGIALRNPKRTTTVVIPPAGRVEFIMQGPMLNNPAQLLNLGFDTGPGGDPNPSGQLAEIRASSDAPISQIELPPVPVDNSRFTGLESAIPTAERKLYFSELQGGINTTQFFITVDGQVPRLYDPDEPPAIVTTQGAVEDWTIDNRTFEVHAFHIHQVHFLVLEVNGQPVEHILRDTVVIPYWDGKTKHFPSVKIRMDFRDPETVGTFLYHCHILDHEDGGMMAKIQVLKSDGAASAKGPEKLTPASHQPARPAIVGTKNSAVGMLQ